MSILTSCDQHASIGWRKHLFRFALRIHNEITAFKISPELDNHGKLVRRIAFNVQMYANKRTWQQTMELASANKEAVRALKDFRERRPTAPIIQDRHYCFRLRPIYERRVFAGPISHQPFHVDRMVVIGIATTNSFFWYQPESVI